MTGPVPPLELRLPEEADLSNLESPDESEETCDFICEVSTQATDASSAPDMSIDAVVLWDDPP